MGAHLAAAGERADKVANSPVSPRLIYFGLSSSRPDHWSLSRCIEHHRAKAIRNPHQPEVPFGNHDAS
jgi:hypothetical protein